MGMQHECDGRKVISMQMLLVTSAAHLCCPTAAVPTTSLPLSPRLCQTLARSEARLALEHADREEAAMLIQVLRSLCPRLSDSCLLSLRRSPSSYESICAASAVTRSRVYARSGPATPSECSSVSPRPSCW